MNEKKVQNAVVELIRIAQTQIPSDVIFALKQAHQQENGIAKIQLEAILKNIILAKNTNRPLCQDTGILTFYIEIGYQSPFISTIDTIIIQAVKKATKQIPLRINAVDVLSNTNSSDNVGKHIPIIIKNIIQGDAVHITCFPKGSGSENMSRLGMLKPSDGIEGVKSFVVNEVVKAGGQPCPPTVIGVGIGGSADLCLKLGKKALLRPVGKRHLNKEIAAIELELIQRINSSGIGPMGLGGKTTVLDVHVEIAHRHPASLPVGIAVQCWANRRASMTVFSDGHWEF